MATVLLSTAISGSAQATPPGQVELTLYGAGASSCGKWLADRTSLIHSIELNWVFGFLTASENYSASLGVHVRQTDKDAVEAFVDKYCRENPLKDIADASVGLVLELSKPE